MKHLLPLHLARNLVLYGFLLALSCGLGRAQAPVAQRLDVFFGDTKLLPIDGPIDSFAVTPDNIIKVDKSDGSPDQLSIVGLAGGSASLTVKSNGRTLVYDVAVSPAPVRLYINLNESQRLTFPNPIDDTSLSQQGIVRVVQPDTGNNILLVEANTAGKTTLTVTCKGEIYRYFISTFENRGADVLEIQNAFSQKGYRNLTITFDKDQATISGTVPTQEELDDAVRIVKQFTQFVIVKANLGQEIETSEYSEQEAIVINNIQRIANVKGLTVRVKFPAPTVTTTSTYTKSTGDYISPETTTTPQGGTIRGSGFNPPATQDQSGAGGPTELKPQENTTQVVTTSENTSLPEKIFLYGDMQDDLDEAKVLRVARTFCPFVVNFLTVKDPIQIRAQIRFMQVSEENFSNVGFDWSGAGGGPTIGLGFGGGPLGVFPNPISVITHYLTANPFTGAQGVSVSPSIAATINLFETLKLIKEIRQAELFLSNGQPGWYSEGEVKTYVSNTTAAITNGIETVTAQTSQIFVGVNMDISPLNSLQANGAGTDPQGQKILGIQNSQGSFSPLTDTSQSNDKIGKITFSQQGGSTPNIDNTVKYVDENGLIGLNISTQLTIPGTFAVESTGFQNLPVNVTLPDIFVRTTRTRVSLRDGQTVAIDGLIDKQASSTIKQLPFLSKIPLFSTFFKTHANGSDATPNGNEEVIVLVTPHIVRMRDPDSYRYPRPSNPAMETMAREFGDVPIIKPVRYDAAAVDLRPETPKDMKNVNVPSTPPPQPALHAGGGMQALQPATESAPVATPAVDRAAPAPDISRQPSAPLAPSSTLP